MFKKFLTKSVSLMNFFHNAVLKLNDNSGIGLSDKQLHFIFIGLLGVVLFIVVYLFFNHLMKKNRVISIAWIYVFTILVAFTLAIEIGQKITGSGDMDFADIVAGILGYIVLSLIVIIVKKVYNLIRKNRK